MYANFREHYHDGFLSALVTQSFLECTDYSSVGYFSNILSPLIHDISKDLCCKMLLNLIFSFTQ